MLRRGEKHGRSVWGALVLGVVAVWGGLAPSWLAAQESRTWSDSTGKFKIQGKFVSVEEGKVTIERDDGKKVVVDLKRLSAADQKYVAEQQSDAANPFMPVEEPSPSRLLDRAKGARLRRPTASTTEQGLRPDWSSAKAVSPGLASEEWKVSIAAEKAAVSGKPGKAIAVPPKSHFFESAKALIINETCRRAVLGYTIAEPRPTGQSRLVLVDLDKNKSLGAATISGQFAPLALHDNGTQVLMRRDDFGFGNQDRLEVWSLTPSGIQKGVQFVPYDDAKRGPERDVKWGAFLDENRMATVSGGGKLAVWKWATAEPEYYLGAARGCVPALSPDRKFIAFATGKELGVLDAGKGEVIALKSSPSAQQPTLRFSPSGSRLACAAFDRLYVWDTATGGLYREIPYLGMNVMGEIAWPSEDHVLLGKKYLIDLETQVRLWTYEGAELAATSGGVTWFYVAQGTDGAGALVPARLPHPAATEALEKALADPNFFILKEGATVRINVDAVADPAEREKARTALTAKLQANGCQVVPNGAIELVASTEVGKEREITYQTMGMGFAHRTYKYREHICRIKFLYQGQTAWETAAVNAPGFIVHLKEGQTLEQFIKEHERPNYAFFSTVDIPKLLQRPSASLTLGVSQVTVAGIQSR